MKKKLFTIFAVFSLVCFSLLAGGASENPADKTADGKTVIRVSWWGNQLRNDITQQVIDMYMEENPNVVIESEFTDWSTYWDKLATQAAGGELPDVIQMDYSYILQYANSGQLASLDGYIDSGVIDTTNIAESVIESGSVDGTFYAFSLGSTAPMMIYDAQTLEQAGIEVPFHPTISEFYDICQKVYDATGIPMYYDGTMGRTLSYVARAMGKNIYEELLAGNEDVVLKHFQILEDFVKAPFHISPELLAETNPDVVDQMPINDLTCWNQFTVSNGFTATQAACGGRDLVVSMYPTLDDAVAEAQYIKPTMFFSVAETSEVKDEAAKFINWFVNDVEANQILKGERGVPANTEVAEAISKTASAGEVVVYDYMAKINDIAATIDPPDPAGSGEVSSLLITYIDNIRYGLMTAEEATREFVPQAQEILAIAQE